MVPMVFECRRLFTMIVELSECETYYSYKQVVRMSACPTTTLLSSVRVLLVTHVSQKQILPR